MAPGRPTKKRGFKGTPKTVNVETDCGKIDTTVNSDPNIPEETSDKKMNSYKTPTPMPKKQCVKVLDFYTNRPLGLVNGGKNVCFFNSVIQALYSITEFRDYVLQLPALLDNISLLAIIDLFKEIRNSNNNPVVTSNYLKKVYLIDYIFGNQYDAHECLLQFLEIVYPTTHHGDNMFKVSWLESVQCNCLQQQVQQQQHRIENICHCSHNKEKLETENYLQLEVHDLFDIQTITSLIEDFQVQNNVVMGYKCDGCNHRSTSNKSDLLTSVSNVLIIHLKLFRCEHNRNVKIIPNLNIEENISCYGNLTLHAIVYHEGNEANSGHYTCDVKVNNKWFEISDTTVKEKRDKNFSCRQTDYRVPYIVMYKKNNGESNNVQQDMPIIELETPPSNVDEQCTSGKMDDVKTVANCEVDHIDTIELKDTDDAVVLMGDAFSVSAWVVDLMNDICRHKQVKSSMGSSCQNDL